MDYEPDRDRGKEAADERTYDAPETEQAVGIMQDYCNRISQHTRTDDCYEAAEAVLDGNDVPPEAIEAGLETFEGDPKYKNLGYLLAAAYNQSNETSFVFDPDDVDTSPLKGIGFSLEEENILVLEEPFNEAGYWAEGMVVNNSDSATFDDEQFGRPVRGHVGSTELGRFGKGTFINNGTIDHLAPEPYGSSVAINAGRANMVANNSPGESINFGEAGLFADLTSSVNYNTGGVEEIGEWLGVTISETDADRIRVPEGIGVIDDGLVLGEQYVSTTDELYDRLEERIEPVREEVRTVERLVDEEAYLELHERGIDLPETGELQTEILTALGER